MRIRSQPAPVAQRLLAHRQRKAAAQRKEAARYRDGKGYLRVEFSRARAALAKGEP